MKPTCHLAILLAGAIVLSFTLLARAELVYPLAAPQAISNNFGQYRHGHPHSGLDLWTGLQLGTPVLAVDDGVIVRLKVSSAGYGRSVYLRLSDGRQAVYGHLERFAPRIENALPTPAGGLYRADKTLAGKDVIAVKRGEVIGYAGDAGTDVAHLHFELRDAGGTPINPLANGFPYRDTLAPVFAALHLQPLTATARVEGGPDERFFTFQAAGAGEYRLPPVWISGRVGLSVDASDRIDGTPRRLAPYELRLTVDDRTLFVHRFDRSSYSVPYANELSYHSRLVAEQKGYFIRLYRWLQPTYFQGPDGTGDLSALAPGRHRAELTATDESGNRARAVFELVVAPACTVNQVEWLGGQTSPRLDVLAPGCREVRVAIAGQSLAPRRQSTDTFSVELARPVAPGSQIDITARGEAGPEVQAGYFTPGANRNPIGEAAVLTDPTIEWGDSFAIIRAKIADPAAGQPRVEVRFEPGSQLVPTDQWRLSREADRLTLTIPQPSRFQQAIHVDCRWFDRQGAGRKQELRFPFLVARNGGSLSNADRSLRLEIPNDALFREAPLSITEADPSVPTWLRAVGKATTFSAAWEPLKKDLVAHFRLGAKEREPHLGVYLYDRGTWWYLGSPVRAKLSLLGTIAVLRDLEPPRIVSRDLGRGSKPLIKLIATDRGSGIDAKKIRVSLDGRAQPFEYWSLKDQILVWPTIALPPGTYRLQVELQDRAGNPGRYSSELKVEKAE